MNIKQREELEKISSAIKVNTLQNGVRTVVCSISIEDIKHIVDNILANPLRNCEVGTIEEQIKRFYDEFYAKDSKCKRRWSFGECALDWAQMPSYESEVTDETP